MPSAPAPHSPWPAGLIERDREQGAVAAAIAGLAGGTGGALVFEAAPGLGKTALVEHAERTAIAAGVRVRRAASTPLERHFPFGVMRALLEAPLRALTAVERERLLDEVTRPAAGLLLDGRLPPAGATIMLAHSVLWLCSALAEPSPLALLVDDAQWCDGPSLKILAYVARRVGDVPVLLVVATRPDDPEATADAISLVGGGPRATVLRPQPLSAAGAAVLLRRAAPDASEGLCLTCHRAAGGNPWLLGELGRQYAAHGADALTSRYADIPVSAVAREVVRRRLAALGPSDRAAAAALAVVGDDTGTPILAEVAGIGPAEVVSARDALRSAGLLDESGARWAHRLFATAIAEDLPAAEVQRLHRLAAAALVAAGARDAVVAGHLLALAPGGDPEVSARLRRAADSAARDGAPASAAAYLERALEERAAGDDRGEMLSRLTTLVFDAGLPGASRWLREALDHVRDREGRIDALTRLAALTLVDGGETAAMRELERELAADSDPATRAAVEAAALDALLLLRDRHSERARRAAAADPGAAGDPLIRDVLSTHRAWLAVELGEPDAAAAARTARRALASGALLAAAGRRTAYHLCARILVLTDRLDDAATAIASLRREAEGRGSLRLRAAASWYAAELALRAGRVRDAEIEARFVLDVSGDESNLFVAGATEVLVCALIERGALAEAREALEERGLGWELDGHAEVGARFALARLLLAEGDFERAAEEARATGALREGQGRPNPSWSPWRSTAALALAHLDRRAEAAALADEELALAERFGAPLPRARALHARAVAEADDGRAVAFCGQGLSVLGEDAASLEALRLRLELGARHLRAGRRLEARTALRRTLADGDAVGATVLAARARDGLVATGLRPRRAALAGAAALTPRQRQVCELAAAGVANRAIAQQLFLSVKTVENHLALAYRKLGVATRDELAACLSAGGPASPADAG